MTSSRAVYSIFNKTFVYIPKIKFPNRSLKEESRHNLLNHHHKILHAHIDNLISINSSIKMRKLLTPEEIEIINNGGNEIKDWKKAKLKI